MREYTTTWNDVSELPNINEQIIIAFGNGLGTDKRFPYKVEDITKHKRGDFNIYDVEGRQLKVDGSFREVWFQLFFTDKPKGHIGWKSDQNLTIKKMRRLRDTLESLDKDNEWSEGNFFWDGINDNLKKVDDAFGELKRCLNNSIDELLAQRVKELEDLTEIK